VPATAVSNVMPVPVRQTPATTLLSAAAPVVQAPPLSAPQVTISDTGYKAMELQQRNDLLKDIQKVVRNELLLERNTTPIVPGGNIQSVTDSTAQGEEYESSCYKDNEVRCPKNPNGTCPPIPDKSDYIKKDAIPCWGCNIDY
jgi:hypothetical protein